MRSAPRISTTAPIPNLRDILALLKFRSADDRTLASPWLHDDDRPFLFSRSTWALYVVALACSYERQKKPTVWLPDYFCNQATGPLRDIAEITFYPIAETLEPDWEACASGLKDSPPDVFILVHYFGRPADTVAARKFCDTQGAVLVEDAAHVLMPVKEVGKLGDCTIWSLYKHLALPDGGLLTLRSIGGIKEKSIETAIKTLNLSAPTALPWFAKRLLQRVTPSLAARLRSRSLTFDDDGPAERVAVPAAMSLAARRLLRKLNTELSMLARRRRENGAALLASLTETTDLSMLLPNCSEDWVPYRAVFRATSHRRASSIYEQICSSGSVVETWPDVPPEVKASPSRHGVALALRNTSLTIPIPVDLTSEELVAAYSFTQIPAWRPMADESLKKWRVFELVAWLWIFCATGVWLIQFFKIVPILTDLFGWPNILGKI